MVASPVSNLAFVTYNGNEPWRAAALLRAQLNGRRAGTVGYVALTGGSAITAPLAGAFTPDDSIFFVSTAGDNKIHYITIPNNPSAATPPTDSQQISPNLPACTPVSAGGNDAGCTYHRHPGPSFRLQRSSWCRAPLHRLRISRGNLQKSKAGLAPAFLF